MGGISDGVKMICLIFMDRFFMVGRNISMVKKFYIFWFHLRRHSNGNKSVLKWSQNSAHVSDDGISAGIRLPQKGQRGQVFDRILSLARRICCIFFVLYCLFSVLCVLSLQCMICIVFILCSIVLYWKHIGRLPPLDSSRTYCVRDFLTETKHIGLSRLLSETTICVLW